MVESNHRRAVQDGGGAKPLTDMPFTPGKILRALGKV